MTTTFYTATTLDGFLATADHSLDWLFEVPGADDAESSIPDFTSTVGALAMGSSTFEWVVRHEDLLNEPHKWGEWYGDRPTWVFTTRDLPIPTGADIQLTQAPVAQVHAEMTTAAGNKDIWLMGGGDLVGQFADGGLLDRIIVTIAPVTLGAGAPLLPRDIRSDRLKLISAEQMGQFVQLTYDLT